MTLEQSHIGVDSAYERLEQLSERTRELPVELRELVEEVLQVTTINLEELQAAVEELKLQNKELRAARQEVELQHRHYRDLFEFAPDGYLVTDLAGIIRDANQAAGALLEVPQERLTGKPLAAYVVPEDQKVFHTRLSFMIVSGAAKTSRAEWEVHLQPGRRKAFLAALTVIPIRDLDGKPTGLRWRLRDVSASRRAEERERLLAEVREHHQLATKANQLLQTLIDTMPVGMVIADAGGRTLSTNAAGRDILRGAVSGSIDAPSRSYTAYYADGAIIPLEELPLVRAVKEGRTTRNLEIILRWTEAEQRTILASAAPVRDEAGEIVSGILVVQDITPRKVAMDALETEQARLKAIIENTPTGIIVTDEQGRVVLANPAAYALYGRAISIGHRVGDASGVSFYHSDGTPFDSRDLPITRSALEGETITGVEVVVTQPDGQQFDLLVNSSPIRDKEGRIQGAISALRDISEIKRFMSELETEQTRLKTIIENVPAGIVVSDLKGNISLINPAFEALYKRVLSESKAGVKLCRPDGTPYSTEDMPFARSAISGEVIAGEEMSIIWADGEQTDLLVNSAPIRDGEDGQRTAVGTFQDITDIKQTQRTLQLYADRLRVLNSASRHILASESADEIVDAVLPFISKLVHWQRASVMVFDHEKSELTILGVHARPDTLLRKGLHLPLAKEWPFKELAEGEIFGLDITRGSILQAELTHMLQAEGVHFLILVPLLAHGQLLGVLSMGFNEPTNLTLEYQEIVRQTADGLAIGIWQARLHEQLRQHATQLEQIVARRTAALRDSEARFRTVFEASVIGIALLNDKGQIVASNPAFQNMLGHNEDELAGTSLIGYMHPDDIEEAQKSYNDLAARKLDDYVGERRYVHKDGSQRWAELTVSRVKRPNQKKRSFAIALAKDITQRKINQEALIRSERLAIAGRLGASLAHEINNPLQSVIGCLGLAEETLDEHGASEACRYLNIATEELERAAGIVHQLRDLSRSSEMTKEPADLNALIEKALLLTKRQCQDQEVEVEWVPAADLPPISLVSNRMQQVFLNLLINAVEAMPEGGRLRVQTVRTSRPKGARITFSDSGVGIEPGKLEQLFEPFQSTRPGGLGLGLYISKNIMNDHNGSIAVDSRPGKGTTFTLWLPA